MASTKFLFATFSYLMQTCKRLFMMFLHSRKRGNKIIFSFCWIIYLTLQELSKTQPKTQRKQSIYQEAKGLVGSALSSISGNWAFEMDEIWADSWQFLNWKKKGMILFFRCFYVQLLFFQRYISIILCCVKNKWNVKR